MARKQYRGIMVTDFEVDGSFQTVAKLETLWKEAALEIERKLAAELPEAKISPSGDKNEFIQADLQDRRGGTGDIKNVVFRGGRGKNERMSRTQMIRYEDLWRKKWINENFYSSGSKVKRSALPRAETKLYNQLHSMVERQGLFIDITMGRIRDTKTKELAYPDGMVDVTYNFYARMKHLEMAVKKLLGEDSGVTENEKYSEILSDLYNGKIVGIDDRIQILETEILNHAMEKIGPKGVRTVSTMLGFEGAMTDDLTDEELYSAVQTGIAEKIKHLKKIPGSAEVGSPEMNINDEPEAERPEDLEEFGGPNDMRGKETLEFKKPGGKKTIVRTIKLPVGTFKFDGMKGSFTASKRDFRNRLVHSMGDKERNEFLNGLLKGLLKAEKSETVSRITRVIKQAKEEPTEDKFDDIWQTMDFKSMQGQKAN